MGNKRNGIIKSGFQKNIPQKIFEITNTMNFIIFATKVNSSVEMQDNMLISQFLNVYNDQIIFQ